MNNDKSQMLELVERIQEWHVIRLHKARDIQTSVTEGKIIQAGPDAGADKKFHLSKREAVIFALGMEAGLAHFEKLPFRVSLKSDEHENDEGDEE